MSTPTAASVFRLNDQASGMANDVAKALGVIAASEGKLKSSFAALKRQAMAERDAASAALRRFAALSGANGRAAGLVAGYQAQALSRKAVASAVEFQFSRGTHG